MATDWKTPKCSGRGASSINTDTSQGTTTQQSTVGKLFLSYYEIKSKLNRRKKYTAPRHRCAVVF